MSGVINYNNNANVDDNNDFNNNDMRKSYNVYKPLYGVHDANYYFRVKNFCGLVSIEI